MALLQAAKLSGTKVFGLAELEQLGSKQIVPAEPPKPSDLSTIMYTSGTTGEHRSRHIPVMLISKLAL